MKKLTILVIAFFMASSIFAQAKILERNNAFYIYLKGSKIELTAIDELNYAKSFEAATYREYRNDEFEWDEQFTKIKQTLKEKIDGADLGSSYSVTTRLEFGDYDFTNEGFPLSIDKTAFFQFDYFDNWYDIDSGTLLDKRVALKLDRLEEYNFFSMPKTDAKQFLQGRKDYRGNINREISLLMIFKIAAFDSEEYKSFADFALSNNFLPIVGNIEKIEVYDTNIGGTKKQENWWDFAQTKVYDTADEKNIRKIGELIKK